MKPVDYFELLRARYPEINYYRVLPFLRDVLASKELKGTWRKRAGVIIREAGPSRNEDWRMISRLIESYPDKFLKARTLARLVE